jgi:hypothetical protein
VCFSTKSLLVTINPVQVFELHPDQHYLIRGLPFL